MFVNTNGFNALLNGGDPRLHSLIQAGYQGNSCVDGDASGTGVRHSSTSVWREVHPDPSEFPVRSRMMPYEMSQFGAFVLGIAKETRPEDVVVMFGRDMEVAAMMAQAWEKDLPGTWVYVEGVRRSFALAGWDTLDSAFTVPSGTHLTRTTKWVASVVKPLVTPTTRVFGVDTGFKGTVPIGSLLPLVRWANKLPLEVRLMSNHFEKDFGAAARSRGVDTSQVQVKGMKDPEPSCWVNLISSIEDMHKVFMRPQELTGVDTDGSPILEFAGWKSFQFAMGDLLWADRMARKVRPQKLLACSQKDQVSLLQDAAAKIK